MNQLQVITAVKSVMLLLYNSSICNKLISTPWTQTSRMIQTTLHLSAVILNITLGKLLSQSDSRTTANCCILWTKVLKIVKCRKRANCIATVEFIVWVMIVVLHLLVMHVPYFDRFILTADDVALVWEEVDVTFPQVIFALLKLRTH